MEFTIEELLDRYNRLFHEEGPHGPRIRYVSELICARRDAARKPLVWDNVLDGCVEDIP